MRGNLLARLGGARPDVLAEAPGDLSKHTSMGAVLLSTGAVSAASAAFALNTALDLSPVAAVLVGLIWGLVIVNLDRMLVVSMVRDDGWVRNVLIALPRLALALILGAVISAPLVLKIFEPEIKPEVQVIIREDEEKAQAEFDNDIRFTRIEPLEDEVEALQRAAAGSVPAAAVSDDPDVQAATAARDAAQKALDETQSALEQEIEGTAGSRKRGEGPVARQKAAARDRSAAALSAAQADLDRITADVTNRIAGTAQTTQQQAATALSAKQAELNKLREQRAEAAQRLRKDAPEAEGLINQLKALDRLSNTPTLNTARWALLLLFASIEILPVLVKLLSLLGKPTLYDRLAGRRDATALEEDSARSEARRIELDAATEDRRTEITAAAEARQAEARFDAQVRRDTAQMRMNTVLAIEQGRSELQVEAGRRNNVVLVQKQEEMATRAIDRWAQVASVRTDEELDRWHAAQSAHRGPEHTAGSKVNGSAAGPPDGHLDGGHLDDRHVDDGLHDPPTAHPEPGSAPPIRGRGHARDRVDEPRPIDRRPPAANGDAMSYREFLTQEKAAAAASRSTAAPPRSRHDDALHEDLPRHNGSGYADDQSTVEMERVDLHEVDTDGAGRHTVFDHDAVDPRWADIGGSGQGLAEGDDVDRRGRHRPADGTPELDDQP